jgi:hypothetical protein
MHASASEVSYEDTDILTLDAIANTPHDEFVNAGNRDRLHSKVYAENMVRFSTFLAKREIDF